MPAMIGIDWGTSSFRAYLLDSHGSIVKRVHTDAGILSVEHADFSSILDQQISSLGQSIGDLPMVVSGMITSKNGWVETPYVECPASVADLAASLVPHDTDLFGRIWFVPGVKQLVPEPDIMRGEETQLAGLKTSGEMIVILPGTHSKWVKIQNGMITRFKTFMTGDIYSAVLQSTILRTTPENSWSDEMFTTGVQHGYTQYTHGVSILSELFQVRVQSILGLRTDKGTRSYLSGLLIGTELAEAINSGFIGNGPYTIIGNDKLAGLYLNALTASNYKGRTEEADLASQGLYKIALSKKLF